MFSIFKKRKKEENTVTPTLPPQNNPVILDQLKQITDSLSNFSKAIRNLEARTHDIMEKLDTIEEKVAQHDDEIKNVKDSIEKMFVLYDWVMKQYNPFIEDDNVKETSSYISRKNTNEANETSKTLEIEGKEYLPLDEIRDDPAFIAIIMGWLHYLVSKSNIEETMKALEYYENVGWITEKVKIELEKYLEGYKSVQGEGYPLTPEDHLVSLYIITKLKSGIDSGLIKFRDLYEELVNKGIIKPVR